MPQVSVIVPTYNRAQLLKQAISSVLKQTFKDFEIIIIDDASSDDTQETVSSFNDKRIKYIRHPVNKGEAGARNTGILNSDSEYIAFLDDDDEWLPEKLDMQVNKIVQSQQRTGLITTGYFISQYINNKLVREGQKIPSRRGNIHEELMKSNFIECPSVVLIKRRCVDVIGLFDPAISYGLDYDYWIRISKHFDFDYIAECLAKYRVHKNRLSNDIELRAQGAQDLAKKYGHQIISSNYWRSIYLPLGIERCNRGDMIKGISALLQTIRYYPLNRSSYLYFGISLLGHSNFKRAIMFKERLRTQLKTLKNAQTFRSE